MYIYIYMHIHAPNHLTLIRSKVEGLSDRFAVGGHETKPHHNIAIMLVHERRTSK